MQLTKEQRLELISLCEDIIDCEESWKVEITYERWTSSDNVFQIMIHVKDHPKWYKDEGIYYNDWDDLTEFNNCKTHLQQILEELKECQK